MPVAQLQVALHVALDDADGTRLLHALLVCSERGRERWKEEQGLGGGERRKRRRNSLSPEVASTSGLELDDDFSQLDVSLFL